MQSLSKLDTPMYKLFGRNTPKKGDFGIELELEGSLKAPDGPWIYKEEGSLRGGGEYILANPISLAKLSEGLLDLQKTLDSCKPKISIRCSTHIHVNVLELTARQIWQFILAYYMLEPLLMRTQPEKRWGNLFCLTMEHAEGIFLDLRRDMQESSLPFKSFTKERNRYSALNLVSIGKFGSVEFRFLDAYTDTTKIEAWCRLLYNLVRVGSGITPMQLLKLYDELTPPEFVQQLLGDHAGIVLDKFPSASYLNSMIHTNYDFVYELAHNLSSLKFEMPAHLWNADMGEVGLDGIDFHTASQIYQQAFAEAVATPTFNPVFQHTNSPPVWGTVPTPGGPVFIDDPVPPPAPQGNPDDWDAPPTLNDSF